MGLPELPSQGALGSGHSRGCAVVAQDRHHALVPEQGGMPQKLCAKDKSSEDQTQSIMPLAVGLAAMEAP